MDPVSTSFHILDCVRMYTMNSHYSSALLRKAVQFCCKKKKEKVGQTESWWVCPALRPLLSYMKRGSCFCPQVRASESGQRLPKINRLSVQPRGWVRVSLHGAGLSRALPAHIQTQRLTSSLDENGAFSLN